MCCRELLVESQCIDYGWGELSHPSHPLEHIATLKTICVIRIVNGGYLATESWDKSMHAKHSTDWHTQSKTWVSPEG